jgi:DNA-binding transcriptional regulator WhiA
LSYSYELKREICASRVKNKCCRRNILRAALLFSPPAPDGRATLPVMRRQDIREYFLTLLSEIYPSSIRGETPDVSELGVVGDTREYRCSGCQRAFLRGLFLAYGSVTDPSAREYNLDFTFREKSAADAAAEILAENGISAKVKPRREYYIAYIKSSDNISDFFALIGAPRATFDIINTKIAGGVKNDANRVRNTDVYNIEKSMAASERVRDAVRFLRETDRLNLLPPDLYETALLREEYPYMSLFQLAAVSPSHMTKSGIATRLKKITETAEKYGYKKDSGNS